MGPLITKNEPIKKLKLIIIKENEHIKIEAKPIKKLRLVIIDNKI